MPHTITVKRMQLISQTIKPYFLYYLNNFAALLTALLVKYNTFMVVSNTNLRPISQINAKVMPRKVRHYGRWFNLNCRSHFF